MSVRLQRLRTLSMAAVMLALLIAAAPGSAFAQRGRTDRGKRVSKRTERVVAPKRTRSAPVRKSTPATGKRTSRNAGRAAQGRSTPGRAAQGRSTPGRGSTSRSVQSQGSTSRSVQSRASTSRSVQSRGSTSRTINSGRRQSAGKSGSVVRGNRSRLYIPSVRNFPWTNRSYRATYSYRYFPKIRWYPVRTLRIRWPRIHLHISWPWLLRYRRHWAPTYRYRQVVYVQTRWGSRERASRVELETHYSHELRYADDQKAELVIFVEQIDVYYEGRYLGNVQNVPESLGAVRATVYKDGTVHFDRDIFVMGDPYEGFELISTRHYDGYVMDDFRESDGYRAGRLDLTRSRVSRIGRSRLFNPYDASGHFPISLLPENEGWLWDFGADAISASDDDYNYYYGYESAGRDDSAAYSAEPRRFENEVSFRTEAGTEVYLKRESQIQRVE